MCSPYLPSQVGYVEEMAVYTYSNIIELMDTPGSKLHTAWHDKEVPPIAMNYWRMPETASFSDLIKQIGQAAWLELAWRLARSGRHSDSC